MPALTKEKAVAAFRKANGPAVAYRPFKPADSKRLGGRLLPTFRLLAEEDGWAAYARQALWHCDPDDWAGVADDWLDGEGRRDVMMRTGFGDLIVLSGTEFWLVMPHESARMPMGASAEWVLGYSLQNPDSYFRKHLPGMMKKARKAAGEIGPDEMYTYVPALALGGHEDHSKIEVVKAREALKILSQLDTITSYGS